MFNVWYVFFTHRFYGYNSSFLHGSTGSHGDEHQQAVTGQVVSIKVSVKFLSPRHFISNFILKHWPKMAQYHLYFLLLGLAGSVFNTMC